MARELAELEAEAEEEAMRSSMNRSGFLDLAGTGSSRGTGSRSLWGGSEGSGVSGGTGLLPPDAQPSQEESDRLSERDLLVSTSIGAFEVGG